MTSIIKPPAIPQPFRPTSVPGHPSLPGSTLTGARNDEELIEAWLRRPNLAAPTVRHSRKEAERFLWWCRAHGQALRDVRVEHLFAYSAFVLDPQPADEWVSTVRRRRDDPRWRPFCGPLSPASHRQALIIVAGLFAWAKAAGYLPSNPAELLGALPVAQDDTVTRFLPPVAISLMLEAADGLSAGAGGKALRRARARFLVQAFYLTGARLAELAGADMGSLRRDDVGAWWLHVIGKGSRPGKMPAPPDLVAEFRRYREAFGLAPLPEPGDAVPLILTSQGEPRRASHDGVARMVKALMRDAAALARDAGMPAVAGRLAQASTHWLRHSSLTHQVDAGVPLKTVQRNGRHASLKTTGRYLHKDDAVRHAETVAAIAIRPR